MAKKKSVNKSATIRKYMAKHRKAGPKEVQAALAKKGIDVSEGLISNVKYAVVANQKKTTSKKPALRKKKVAKKRKAVRKRATRTKPLEDVKQASELMFHAVELVMKAGAKEAKQLVNMAADMVKKIRG